MAKPPGTDPFRAAWEFDRYHDTKIETDELHYAAIGSFGIYITVDSIDYRNCTATLDIWMYNSMDRESFGWYSGWTKLPFDPPIGSRENMQRQVMWWNWKESARIPRY